MNKKYIKSIFNYTLPNDLFFQCIITKAMQTCNHIKAYQNQFIYWSLPSVVNGDDHGFISCLIRSPQMGMHAIRFFHVCICSCGLLACWDCTNPSPRLIRPQGVQSVQPTVGSRYLAIVCGLDSFQFRNSVIVLWALGLQQLGTICGAGDESNKLKFNQQWLGSGSKLQFSSLLRSMNGQSRVFLLDAWNIRFHLFDRFLCGMWNPLHILQFQTYLRNITST